MTVDREVSGVQGTHSFSCPLSFFTLPWWKITPLHSWFHVCLFVCFLASASFLGWLYQVRERWSPKASGSSRRVPGPETTLIGFTWVMCPFLYQHWVREMEYSDWLSCISFVLFLRTESHSGSYISENSSGKAYWYIPTENNTANISAHPHVCHKGIAFCVNNPRSLRKPYMTFCKFYLRRWELQLKVYLIWGK